MRKYYVVAEVGNNHKISFIGNIGHESSLCEHLLEDWVNILKEKKPELKEQKVTITFFHKLDN